MFFKVYRWKAKTWLSQAHYIAFWGYNADVHAETPFGWSVLVYAALSDQACRSTVGAGTYFWYDMCTMCLFFNIYIYIVYVYGIWNIIHYVTLREHTRMAPWFDPHGLWRSLMNLLGTSLFKRHPCSIISLQSSIIPIQQGSFVVKLHRHVIPGPHGAMAGQRGCPSDRPRVAAGSLWWVS